MKQDYARLLDDLRANPTMGTDFGHHLRKVRMAIASKGKGKRGGARVITYTVILAQVETEIKLITIYDKAIVPISPTRSCWLFSAETALSE